VSDTAQVELKVSECKPLMAGILCDLMTTKLLNVADMFGKIKPKAFAESLAPSLKAGPKTHARQFCRFHS